VAWQQLVVGWHSVAVQQGLLTSMLSRLPLVLVSFVSQVLGWVRVAYAAQLALAVSTMLLIPVPVSSMVCYVLHVATVAGLAACRSGNGCECVVLWSCLHGAAAATTAVGALGV
jgi:hypothetical protein